MWQILAVAAGGAVGCVSRLVISEGIYAVLGRSFPYGILTVNIIGSLLMGFLATLIINKLELGFIWRGAILVGFLGGLTTFSSFSIDTVQLMQEGFWFKAGIYVLASVAFCLAATGIGIYVAERFVH